LNHTHRGLQPHTQRVGRGSFQLDRYPSNTERGEAVGCLVVTVMSVRPRSRLGGIEMPKRTNEYQRLVAYIYEQIAPAGGRVTESALLQEPGGGVQREVDILIEHEVAGHDLKIAVECRRHGRGQSVEWIDSLIGKYSRLRVINQIVAVSASPFSNEAKRKAAADNIDLITTNEALTADWIKRIEAWKVMTHSFTLMRIVSLDAAGNELTHTEISQDGKEIKHRDEISKDFYDAVQPYFMREMSADVGRTIEVKIAEKWQQYVDDPTPRWVEIEKARPGITRYGQDMGIDKLVFGVGVFFHVGSPRGEHFALREHALSDVKINRMGAEMTVRIITNPQGNILNFDARQD
jgi:hypothetical protein